MPKITALSAASATVVDCPFSTAELVYQVTGKPVPPVTPPDNDGVTSTLVLSGGTWKVSKQILTDGKMRARLLTPTLVVAATSSVLLGAPRAWAGDPGGQLEQAYR